MPPSGTASLSGQGATLITAKHQIPQTLRLKAGIPVLCPLLFAPCLSLLHRPKFSPCQGGVLRLAGGRGSCPCKSKLQPPFAKDQYFEANFKTDPASCHHSLPCLLFAWGMKTNGERGKNRPRDEDHKREVLISNKRKDFLFSSNWRPFISVR
jgi:hypothetical protein